MMGLGMGFGFLGIVLMLAFWVGLVLLAVWGVKALFPTGGQPSRSGRRDSSARQILDQRYARGELTHEQYDLMKRDLQAE